MPTAIIDTTALRAAAMLSTQAAAIYALLCCAETREKYPTPKEFSELLNGRVSPASVHKTIMQLCKAGLINGSDVAYICSINVENSGDYAGNGDELQGPGTQVGVQDSQTASVD